jgi:hypothetical protein
MNAGIQVKASKVEFGVEEITFHNYRIVGGDSPMANTTTPKDETLDPIRHCSIPQSVTQLKAFLGSTQQMACYVPYYALVAATLQKLTRKGEAFPAVPNGSQDRITPPLSVRCDLKGVMLPLCVGEGIRVHLCVFSHILVLSLRICENVTFGSSMVI